MPWVEAAPTAQASASAAGGSLPRSRPASRPALKQSPAPVASTGDTGGGLGHAERRRELGDGRLAVGEPSQNCPPGRVGERPEHEAEPVRCHS